MASRTTCVPASARAIRQANEASTGTRCVAPRARARVRPAQPHRRTTHAAGDVADVGHDGGRDRRRHAVRIDGAAGGWLAHEFPCACARRFGERLRAREASLAGSPVRLRHLEDRGARRIHERRVPGGRGRLHGIRIDPAARGPCPDPVRRGDPGSRARSRGKRALRVAAFHRPVTATTITAPTRPTTPDTFLITITTT